VRHRLAVYREQTAPLSGFYDGEGLLARIQAIGTVEEVTQRAMAALREAEKRGPAGPDHRPEAG
jgi:adenylate kinase